MIRIPRLPKPTPRYLSGDDLQAFLAALEGHRLRPLFVVSMALALRPSEAIGLRWEDVDLRRRQVTIRRSTQRQGNVIHERGTKTGKERTIPLPDAIVELLRGDRKSREAYVFPNTTGGPLYETYVNRELGRILEKATLPHVTLYQLRHTGATLLLTLGVPLEQVQEILGHSTIAVTRRYAQVVEPLKRDSAARMDAFLRSNVGTSVGSDVSRETPAGRKRQ